MNTALFNLARRGEIDWISAQFAEFVKSRAPDQTNSLIEAIAALLSEQALRGNVCLDLRLLSSHQWFLELVEQQLSDQLELLKHHNRITS